MNHETNLHTILPPVYKQVELNYAYSDSSEERLPMESDALPFSPLADRFLQAYQTPS